MEPVEENLKTMPEKVTQNKPQFYLKIHYICTDLLEMKQFRFQKCNYN